MITPDTIEIPTIVLPYPADAQTISDGPVGADLEDAPTTEAEDEEGDLRPVGPPRKAGRASIRARI